ncbi:hypothetical protein [Blastococcus atacamensis]|uniref:hypothetical protein n=1 Tax=Blastococcus atacamensis TaxID=2070508 RepID=UPI0012FFF595|nr:hypothetical protein [Blastococcus atacamensis]
MEGLRVPLAGGVPARVHVEECAAARVAAVAELRVTELDARDGELAGRLVVRRVDGDQSVSVRRIGRSVLLDAWADLPLELTARAGAAEVGVTFRPGTCEPHVLSETKKPYVFPLEVTLGEEPPVVVELPVDDELRTALADLVQLVCDPAWRGSAPGRVGKEAGPAAPGGTGQPGRGSARRAVMRGGSPSADGGRLTSPRPERT